MKQKNSIILSLIVIIVFVVAYIAAFGLEIAGYRISSIGSSIRQGLDLKGGVYVVEEIQESNIDEDTIDRTIQLIRERVDKFGVVDPTIAKEGEKRIRIEIPGMSDSKQALEFIGKTGYLKFVGPDDVTILDGKDVKDAYVSYDEYNKPQISLEFNESGTQKFADATKKFINQNIRIFLDEDQLVDATVQVAITDGSARITNMESLDTAKKTAQLIKSGSLPVTVKPLTVKTVGPSLGSDALNKSILAGIVGIALVMIFMLLYYKLPGLIADLALIIFILIILMVFILFNVTLTLPGISGFLLTVGMAVDANVLIFERIREELKTGKTLNAALRSGFDRALSAIIDSNLTTIIAGIVLALLGSGPVKGFAVTLIIGVLASMFTAVFVTRYLLKLVIGIKKFNNPKFYGA